MSAIPYLRTPNGTRQCTLKDLKSVILILDDQDPIIVTMTHIVDSSLPVFDLTNGYSGYLGKELNVHFNRWLKKFKSTNGDSWDDDIVIN